MVLRYSSDQLSFSSSITWKLSKCLSVQKCSVPGHCAVCKYATDSTNVAGTEFGRSPPHTLTCDSDDS
ncbi:hypothetical protein DPMN_072290 [Dreissena polymorpha]|uniref:Uncharacterized protein n=1 Tax=Dreissena polymorpha TaxID=45954 RepID=A0A9D3Z5Y8_DREPO|nr:hypothetical protein DPMN_072290 [Dreissena polymorpha]